MYLRTQFSVGVGEGIILWADCTVEKIEPCGREIATKDTLRRGMPLRTTPPTPALYETNRNRLWCGTVASLGAINLGCAAPAAAHGGNGCRRVFKYPHTKKCNFWNWANLYHAL